MSLMKSSSDSCSPESIDRGESGRTTSTEACARDEEGGVSRERRRTLFLLRRFCTKGDSLLRSGFAPHSRPSPFRTIRGASGNTKYGVFKTPRRTENHDGLGLALADPRHPKQLTLQTKAKRRESTRRHRLRTPPVRQSGRRPGSSCSNRLDIGRLAGRLNIK